MRDFALVGRSGPADAGANENAPREGGVEGGSDSGVSGSGPAD
jgi:hypothetical protein